MYNEMKFVGDIILNTQNDSVVGFISDFVSMKKIVTNILGEESVSNFCQPTVNVNQWRYRSVNEKITMFHSGLIREKCWRRVALSVYGSSNAM